MLRFLRLTVRSVSIVVMIQLAIAISARATEADRPGNSEPRSSSSSVADLVARGARYENGENVTQDYRRALALYCEAAGKDDPKADFNIGWMYLNGRGVGRNDAIAAMWLSKAAKHGISQAENLLRILPGGLVPSMRGCATTARTFAYVSPPPAIRALVDQTAEEVGIDPKLVLSVMAVESGYRPDAVSPKMAEGLMQLIPETASRYDVKDPFDERENIRGGASYLRDLLHLFNGDVGLALAAYNAGEGAVTAHGGIPPYAETNSYVAAVKKLCDCDKAK